MKCELSERDQELAMRAEESDKLDYIERYRERGRDERFDPDWAHFIELWDRRKNSTDDMAELLAEVLGVAHDEALAWIEDY
jgi:hypothetical protein